MQHVTLSSATHHQDALADKLPWLALNLACATWPNLRPHVAACVGTSQLWQRLQHEGMPVLEAAVPGLAEKLAVVQQGQAFVQEVERLQTGQVTLVTLLDAAYPKALRWIHEPPPVLYVRGQLHQDDQLAIAVVGSRQPSAYGKIMAQRLSGDLVRHGFTVVSGLARGIDGLAHHGALEAQGRTIAVLGCGINVIYPPEHRRLYEAISAQGAVLSEFPFNTKPDRWNFPRRNRIISGLALGTLVVEASEKSGSLHTAQHAVDQGREVFAVPGRVDIPSSRGAHLLIKRGAKLVESVDDILEELPDPIREVARHHRALGAPHDAAPQPEALTAEEAQVLALVQPEETHIETVLQASQLPTHVVTGILGMLELRGLIRQFPGKFFVRS